MTTVRAQSAEVLDMQEDWTLIDALMGGTKTMRAAGERYLPRWPGELKQSYDKRLATATLFPAYSRTVSVLTGKPFSKPITIGKDVPAKIAAWLDNVDLQHRNLHTFASEVCAEALAYGLCGILVDCPVANGARTVADEKAQGIRPYLLHIRPGNILGWKAEQANGNHRLTQLRLLETVKEDNGPFSTKTIEQVRVLEPGKWEVYRQQLPGDTWTLFDSGTTNLPDIAFVPVYGFRKDFMIGTPPMLELAHASVEHWQSKSDQQTLLHFARVPILLGIALGDTPLVIGGGSVNQTTNEKADLKYVEHSGKAIDAGRISILDLEDRMRQAGAELLVIKPGNITEVAVMADSEQSMCDLQRIMASVEDSLDQALDFMARFTGETSGGHVTIYRDFGAATLVEASADLLFRMNSVGKLSNETTLSELKRRGILSPDIVIAAEIARAKAEAPAAVPTTEVVRP
jgi:hypothetical protein